MPAQAKILDIQEVKSKSGITAWLIEDNSIPVISFQFAFKGAGSVNEPADKQGLAQLLSNTMDEGAGDLDSQAFQKELQDLSISLSFSSGRDHFGGSVKTLTKNSERAFDLLEMAIMRPRFDDEPVQRMRDANKSRIRSSLSNPDWMTARIMNDVAFADHSYAQNSGGTLSTLDAITSDDLRNFRRKHLGTNNLVVAVAGDINAKRLKIILDNVFAGLPEVDIPAPNTFTLKNQKKIAVYKQDIPQTIIEMMTPALTKDDPDYFAAQVMNFVLGSSGFGSRLTEEIREKRGLTYGIYSSLQVMDYTNALRVSTSTKNENVPEMLSTIHKEFNAMREAGITQEELDDAKAYLIGSLPLSLTSTDKISGLMLSLMRDDLGRDYLDRRQKAIEEMTIDDVKTVSSRLLSTDKFVSVLTGNPPLDILQGFGEITTIEALPNVE